MVGDNLNQNSNIRRIDELGRIVVPKDIRKKLHIKDNEPLEIFIENCEIRIRKYSPLPDIFKNASFFVDMGNRITENMYIIADRQQIIAATNENLNGKEISLNLEKYILEINELKNSYQELLIADDFKIKGYMNIVPIIIDNDRSGIIIEYNEKSELKDITTVKIFKTLIEKELNNY